MDEPASPKRMLVIGDLIVDTYLLGNRSPTASSTAPVVQVTATSHCTGGASFSASIAASLGMRTTLFGLVGDDASGRWLRARLRELRIDDEIVVAPDRPTTVKTRIYDGYTLIARADREVTQPIAASVAEHFLARISAQDDVSALLFQDYDKGALTTSLIESITPLALARGVALFADPKHRHFGDYRHCTLFKSNLGELNRYLQTDLIFGSAEFERALVNLCRDRDHRHVLVTADARGMVLADRQSVRYFAAPAGPIVDTCGAGETVLTTAAVSLINGADVEQAVTRGSAAAARVCAALGPQRTWEQVDPYVSSRGAHIARVPSVG